METNKFYLIRNRKDYKIRGYIGLEYDCSSFFSPSEDTYKAYLESEPPENLFIPYRYGELNELRYYPINPISEIISKKLFPKENYEDIDLSIKVLEHKINVHGIDTVLLEISPSEDSKLDFIPLCIIIYKKKTEKISTWRAGYYDCGENLGIFVPKKYNTVTLNGEGLTKNNLFDIWLEVISTLQPKITKEILSYLPEDDDDLEFDKYTLDFAYNLVTGEKLPEIDYNLEELKKSLNLILP